MNKLSPEDKDKLDKVNDALMVLADKVCEVLENYDEIEEDDDWNSIDEINAAICTASEYIESQIR